MGYRGQQNRDDDARAEWARLPLRERYDWHGIALTVVLVAAIVAALLALEAGA